MDIDVDSSTHTGPQLKIISWRFNEEATERNSDKRDPISGSSRFALMRVVLSKLSFGYHNSIVHPKAKKGCFVEYF